MDEVRLSAKKHTSDIVKISGGRKTVQVRFEDGNVKNVVHNIVRPVGIWYCIQKVDLHTTRPMYDKYKNIKHVPVVISREATLDNLHTITKDVVLN